MTTSDPLIKFPCRCGHHFAVGADQAAGLIQCPTCGRLNDVPTMEDLENLSDDGTLIVKAPEPPPSPRPKPKKFVEETRRHFGRDRLDDDGGEIDLRNTLSDLENVGAPRNIDEIPLAGDDARPAKPKYDPETGELIRPIDITHSLESDAPAAIPVAAVSLTYSTKSSSWKDSSWRVLIELFTPANMMVGLFVLGFHLVAQVCFFAMSAGLFLLLPVMAAVWMLILAHYGSTVDEIGPESHDELPPPIRAMSWSEDIWGPFCNVVGSALLCFAPAYVAWTRLDEPAGRLAGAVLLGLGLLMYPAVFLTMSTSGTMNNLRPDRVLRVIRAAGWQYVGAVAALVAAIALYGFVYFGSVDMLFALFSSTASSRPAAYPLLGKPVILYPLLFAAIYATHFFCWHLALIYRHKHEGFEWVLQRHESERVKRELEEAAAIRARRRRAQVNKPQGPA